MHHPIRERDREKAQRVKLTQAPQKCGALLSSFVWSYKMSKLIIKDADAAVTAMDAFASLCLSISEGNYAAVAMDVAAVVVSVKNAIS
jgi:hypothetical protein